MGFIGFEAGGICMRGIVRREYIGSFQLLESRWLMCVTFKAGRAKLYESYQFELNKFEDSKSKIANF